MSWFVLPCCYTGIAVCFWSEDVHRVSFGVLTASNISCRVDMAKVKLPEEATYFMAMAAWLNGVIQFRSLGFGVQGLLHPLIATTRFKGLASSLFRTPRGCWLPPEAL